MTRSVRTAAAVLTLLLAASARSQPPAGERAPAPPRSSERAAAPLAPASGTAYRSVFEGFRGYREQPVEPWRASNDRVREIGGWRAYAQEAQAAPTPSAAGSAAAVSAGSRPATAAPTDASSRPTPAGSHQGHR